MSKIFLISQVKGTPDAKAVQINVGCALETANNSYGMKFRDGGGGKVGQITGLNVCGKT